MKKSILGILLVLCLFFVGCEDDDNTGPETPQTIKIGALLPMTGNYQQQAEAYLMAIQFAVEDKNAELEEDDVIIELVLLDTQADPAIARANALAMIGQGIQCIIGPMLSGELQAVKTVLDDAECLLISPGSTMTELAAIDNIFRIVPNDIEMLDAINTVMENDGIQNLAVINLSDSWGMSLQENIETQFTGSFLGSSDFFSFRESEIRLALDSLSTIITENLTSAEYTETAVFVACYDEGTMILEFADDYDALAEVSWYCCDGYVNNNTILDSTAAAALQFALDTEFRSAIFGVEETDDYTALKTRIELATTQDVNNYAMLCYDAAAIGIDVMDMSDEDTLFDDLKQNLVDTLSGYIGVTGLIEIDSFGDRINGRYDFWGLNDTPEWFMDYYVEDGAIVNQ
jgi:branched-chain amino acid transport system substrate-binding protein